MRLLVPAVLALAVACGPSARVAVHADTAPETENTNPTASAGGETVPTPASAYAGLWLFTHNGADWVTLRIAFEPTTSVTAEQWHDDSWTRFTVTRVKLAPDGSGLRLDAQYDDFEEGITIELRAEAGGLVGTVDGSSYGGAPAALAARRIAP
jgi:hypothetical protein